MPRHINGAHAVTVIHKETGAHNEARENAYTSIESEREYQREKWGERPHEIDAFALYIVQYAQKLADVCATKGTLDLIEKLDHVRKVGALAVACMEQHGAVDRVV
jgi:hypothetical protein